jgi:outer membrane protein assembly factor BamB
VQDNVVYVPGGDGTLYALNSLTGVELWRWASGEELASTPIISSGKLLVASQTDTLFALDLVNGKWLWQYRRDQPSGFTIRGASAPLVDGAVAYIGFSDGYVVAVNIADGTVKWEKALSGQTGQFLDVDSTPAIDETGRLFVASYKDGVYALDSATGELQWHNTRGGVTSLLPKGQVVFTAGDAHVGAVFAEDGKAMWNLDLGSRAGRSPVFARGMLIVPTNTALTFIDPLNGHPRTSWNPGKGVSATPARWSSRIYVLSNLGTLYALRLKGHGG